GGYATDNGIITIVDQMIAPGEVQYAEALSQRCRWPGWQDGALSGNREIICEIEQRTWAAAAHITCPSEYVKGGLLQQGISADKISVIPYPIDSTTFRFVDRSSRD